jgi:hypothetical protein
VVLRNGLQRIDERSIIKQVHLKGALVDAKSWQSAQRAEGDGIGGKSEIRTLGSDVLERYTQL